MQEPFTNLVAPVWLAHIRPTDLKKEEHKMPEALKKKIPLVEARLRIGPDGAANLVGMRCMSCSEITFPRSILCPNCGKEDVEEIALSNRGKVWTYTVIHESYGSMIVTPPFASAFVELEGGGYVHTAIVGCEPEDLSIGMDVQLELLKTSENEEEETVVYAFKPAAAGV